MTETAEKFTYDPEKNYDDDTMAQQRQIEKEVAQSQPMISGLFSIKDITEDYANEDAIYRHKLEDLSKRFQNIRKTRGDGNCFFRAFGFAYLETLLRDTEAYKKFVERAEKSKDELVSLGFPQFTLEDFHDTFMEIIRQVENPATLAKLQETFNDQGLSDYFVVYLRLLVSGHLQKEEESYMPFIDGERTVKEFCAQEVEPMGKESDHIHIVALTKALGVPITVEYMDRAGSSCTAHQFSPSDSEDGGSTPSSLYLLYRPGHYDIIYPV